MNLSVMTLQKHVNILCAGLMLLFGCTTMNGPVKADVGVYRVGRIAVLPVENLSSSPAPLTEIRRSFTEKLKGAGFDVMEEEKLGQFMEKQRMRDISGLNDVLARAFKEDTGATGVLITSVELYDDKSPPKIALSARLVSTGENPEIIWADGIGLAGDDAPGLLDLGLIEDPKILLDKATTALSNSMVGFFSGEESRDKSPDETLERFKPDADYVSVPVVSFFPGEESRDKGPDETLERFKPKVDYLSAQVGIGVQKAPPRLAIMPFTNVTDRKYAAEIIVLHFVREFFKGKHFTVVEPGLIKEKLLDYRIILYEGISLADADLIAGELKADLVLTGQVLDYQDYAGVFSKPKVDFSILLIDRKTGEVAWSSRSHNEGDDAVYFFDWGRVNTAHVLAAEMARAVERMISRK